MTMTMTTDNEEQFIIEQLLQARQSLRDAETNKRQAENKLSAAKKFHDDCEQALIDFMAANGLVQTEHKTIPFTLTQSVYVDVDESGAIPECYLRTKTTTSPDKVAIGNALKRGDLAGANWCKLSTRQHIKVG